MPDGSRRYLTTFFRAHPLLCSVLILITLMLALRLAWGWHVDRLLNAEREALRARGEPTTVADLNWTSLPDDQNAWTLHSAAASAVSRKSLSPRLSNHVFGRYPPYGKRWENLAAQSEKANATVFVLMRQARQRPKSQLISQLPDSLFKLNFQNFGPARDIACVTTDGADFMHFRGNDAEAIERLRDVLHLGRSIHQDVTTTGQLIATSIEGMATFSALNHCANAPH